MVRLLIKILIILILLNLSSASAQRYFQRGNHLCGPRTSTKKTFFEALTKGNTALVKQLLQKGLNPNVTDDCNIPAISYSIGIIQPEILTLLICAGANVNILDGFYHKPPLLWVIDSSNKDNDEDVYNSVKLLIGAGADLNFRGESEKSALTLSVLAENERLVQLLISSGAEINSTDEDDLTAYSHAARINNQSLKKILIAAGADPNIGVSDYLRKFGENAFIEAVADGRTDVVEAMLASGTDVNKVNAGEMPALMRASEESTFEALLNAGADVNLKDGAGFTALHWAVLFRRSTQVKKLIAAGANINEQTAEGKTALNLVTDTDIEALLLAAGARFNR